jgi:hypothetical protein
MPEHSYGVMLCSEGKWYLSMPAGGANMHPRAGPSLTRFLILHTCLPHAYRPQQLQGCVGLCRSGVLDAWMAHVGLCGCNYHPVGGGLSALVLTYFKTVVALQLQVNLPHVCTESARMDKLCGPHCPGGQVGFILNTAGCSDEKPCTPPAQI